MEKIPQNNPEEEHRKSNPNSIGELLSIGKDLPTSPDKVYRSVQDEAAIKDLESSGVVRNKQSAGLVEKSRWDERVFWSRGDSGKYHVVPKGGYVIVAPLAIAEQGPVRRGDILAVYTKNEMGEVSDIWKRNKEIEEKKYQEQVVLSNEKDEKKMQEIRKQLGLDE